MGDIERSGYIERIGGARYGLGLGIAGLSSFNVGGRVADKLLKGTSINSFFASHVIIGAVGVAFETSIGGGVDVEIIETSVETIEGGAGGWKGTRMG